MNSSSRIYNAVLWGILVLLVGGVGYYLYSTRPCAQPIYYKVGTFNTEFGISKEDFLLDAQKAAALWNQEAGHTVLAYSATGTMPLNLIYDNRQQEANIGQSLSQQEAALGVEKNQIDTMQSQYTTQEQQYRADVAARKGAATLNAEAESLNELASNIQTQVTALNAKIDEVNANAHAYNAQAGTDFEEGEYVESDGISHIDLYEFKNQLQLERLMAHEFGHSLGLGHNSNPESIMYPENTAITLQLSTEDKAALQARCALTFQNLNPFQRPDISSE